MILGDRESAGFCAVALGTGRDKQGFEMRDLLREDRVDAVLCARSTSGPRFTEELGPAAFALTLVPDSLSPVAARSSDGAAGLYDSRPYRRS